MNKNTSTFREKKSGLLVEMLCHAVDVSPDLNEGKRNRVIFTPENNKKALLTMETDMFYIVHEFVK